MVSPQFINIITESNYTLHSNQYMRTNLKFFAFLHKPQHQVMHFVMLDKSIVLISSLHTNTSDNIQFILHEPISNPITLSKIVMRARNPCLLYHSYRYLWTGIERNNGNARCFCNYISVCDGTKLGATKKILIL